MEHRSRDAFLTAAAAFPFAVAAAAGMSAGAFALQVRQAETRGLRLEQPGLIWALYTIVFGVLLMVSVAAALKASIGSPERGRVGAWLAHLAVAVVAVPVVVVAGVSDWSHPLTGGQQVLLAGAVLTLIAPVATAGFALRGGHSAAGSLSGGPRPAE